MFDNKSHARLSYSHYEAVRFGDIAVIEGSKTILGYPIEVHLGKLAWYENVYDELNAKVY